MKAPARAEREKENTTVFKEYVRLVRIIAAHTGETMPEVWERLAGKVIVREHKRVTEAETVTLGGEGG